MSEATLNSNETCEELTPECRPPPPEYSQHSEVALGKTAAVFSALGDAERLRMLELLVDGRRCVGALAEDMGESMSLISQRLKILHHARLVVREKDGRHVYYRIADEHVVRLLVNGFDHAAETDGE